MIVRLGIGSSVPGEDVAVAALLLVALGLYNSRLVYLRYCLDVKQIPVAMLRKNLTQALNEVERGGTYIITRHNREVARLVPPETPTRVTAEQFKALLRATPLTKDWAAELKEPASDFGGSDPWPTTP